MRHEDAGRYKLMGPKRRGVVKDLYLVYARPVDGGGNSSKVVVVAVALLSGRGSGD